MLQVSTGRATEVMSRLVEQAGGSERKILLQPSFANPVRPHAKFGHGKSCCVMVVDDEPMALMLSRQVLTKAGFEVVTAQSGLECLTLYRTRSGGDDLVLIDLNMPLMDGEDTFRRLREIDPKAVVVLNTGIIEEIDSGR